MINRPFLGRCCAVVIASMILSSCTTLYSAQSGGTDTEQAFGSLPVGHGQNLKQVFARDKVPAPADVLTPQVQAQLVNPLLVVIFENHTQNGAAQWAGFTQSARNGDVVTWVDGSARTIALTEMGVLRATRGYGRDLISANTEDIETVLRLRSGIARADRIHWLLDGESQAQAHVLVCDVLDPKSTRLDVLGHSYSTVYFEERCMGSQGKEIFNHYWLDLNTGAVRQSRQWISPELGQVLIQRLK